MYSVTLRNDVLDQIKTDHGIRSDRELAFRIGISGPLLSQIRSGRRGVSAAFITGMHTILGVPFDPTGDGLYVLATDQEEAA